MTLQLGSSSRNDAYETEFARYLGNNNIRAFSFWKGRVALYAILQSLGVGSGDEVILPGYTCVVVPNTIRLAGASPVYADILPETYNLNPFLVEKLITPRTKSIIVQHTYGIPGPTQELAKLAKSHGLYLIEDAAHMFGTSWQVKNVECMEDASFFSSQWSKPFTTGLGGMAVTSRPEIAVRLAEIHAQFSQPPLSANLKLDLQYYVFQHFYSPKIYWLAQNTLHFLSRFGLFVGSSSDEELDGDFPIDNTWCMAASQKRAGLKQLTLINGIFEKRKKLVKFYQLGLRANGWLLMDFPEETILLRFPVRVSNKVELLEKACHQRLELGSWFETPLHPVALSKHARFGYILGSCPEAERAASETINLPLHNLITSKNAEQILDFFLINAKKPTTGL